MPDEVDLADTEMAADGLQIRNIVVQARFALRDIANGIGASAITHVIENESATGSEMLKVTEQVDSVRKEDGVGPVPATWKNKRIPSGVAR